MPLSRYVLLCFRFVVALHLHSWTSIRNGDLPALSALNDLFTVGGRLHSEQTISIRLSYLGRSCKVIEYKSSPSTFEHMHMNVKCPYHDETLKFPVRRNADPDSRIFTVL
jgi:hypothetical protein